MDVLITIIVFNLCGLAFCSFLKLEWTHPAVVHALIWLAVAFLSYFYADIQYLPKNYFIFWANACFFISSVIAGNTIRRGCVIPAKQVQLSRYGIILPFGFIFIFYLTLLLKFGITTVTNISAFRELLTENDGANYGLLGRLAMLSLFSSCFLMLGRKKYFLISILLCLPMMIALGAKTLVLLFTVTIMVLSSLTLKFTKIAFYSIVFVAFFFVVMHFRNPDSPINLLIYFFYNYSAGGFLSFSGLTELTNNNFGYYSFRNIYVWISYVVKVDVANVIQPWAYVPFPTNIYTYLRPYYVDFGTIGVIFPMLFGLISGRVYALKRKNIRWYFIAYPIVFYALLMQIFDDQYLTWLANWIILIVVGLLMTRNRKNA